MLHGRPRRVTRFMRNKRGKELQPGTYWPESYQGPYKKIKKLWNQGMHPRTRPSRSSPKN